MAWADKVIKQQNNQTTTPNTTTNDSWADKTLKKAKKQDETAMGTFGTVLDYLQRGQYASANLTEDTLDTINKGEDFTPLKSVISGVTGKDKGSYQDIADEYLPENTPGWAKATAGFAGDVVLDPINLLGVGTLTKTGKVASKVDDVVKAADDIADVSKLDEVLKASDKIEETSKVANEAIDIAKNQGVDAIKLGQNTAEQAAKGQRGLINIAGKGVTPTKLSEEVFKRLGQGVDMAKSTKVGKTLNKAFNTSAGVPDELANLEKQFSRKKLKRVNDAIEESQDLSKQIDDIAKELDINPKKVTELAESTSTKTNELPSKLSEVVNKINKENPEMLKVEQELGIPIESLDTEKMDYMPHIITDDFKKFLKKNPDKGEAYLNKLGDDVLHGSTKGRNIDESIQQANKLANEGKLPGFEDFTGKVFKDDPAIIQGARKLRHAKSKTDAEFLNEVAKRFGDVENGVDITDKIKVMYPGFEGVFEGKKFDKEVAEYITDYVEKMQPQNQGLFLDMYDNVLNTWKKATLLPIPSFHVRNFADNAWKNFLGDVSKESYPQVIKMLSDDAAEVVTESGKKITGTEFRELAEEFGIKGSGLYSKEIDQGLEQLIKNSDSVSNKLKNLGRLNEDFFRQAHFLDKIKKGYSPEKAAESVGKYMFDYGDLTKFEKSTMKRLMPFYTFTRKNLPLQMQTLINKPGKISKVPKSINAINQLSDKPNEEYLPDWIKNSLNVRTPESLTGDKPGYITLDNWISSADLSKLNSGSNALDEMINLLTPMAKTPIELSLNKDTFTKQPIEEFEGETENLLGMNIPADISHVIQSTVPGGRVLREVDQLNPMNIFGSNKQRPRQGTELERVVDFLTGLKSYPYDEQKSKYFAFKDWEDKTQQLMYEIKNANKKNRTDKVKNLKELLKEHLRDRPN